ncbi:BgTH12-00356 [Blumeria graminis f. sp. triticale]|uniref:Bgt-3410 n=3 Tax=Blumeria graminis TaxID=34373 RepID=A0A061HMX2_BLUGR|nr:hypothetical protein BGT96224_3410 [Blumeria graminis f. sp. tritici 96224]CAD6504854.1 BgTH12-00356 [Blumeria graminis f. sp. triticale]VDB92876.1 Bgt-3410 [Blumeria graminis f. sp. tritici]
MSRPNEELPFTTLRLSSSLDLHRSREYTDHDASESFLKQQSYNYNQSTNDDMPLSQKAKSQERRSRLEIAMNWVRWSVVVVMQCLTIVMLLPTSGALSQEGWAGKLINGLGGGEANSNRGSGRCHAPGNDSREVWNLSMTEIGGDVNGLFVPVALPKFISLVPEVERFVPNMTTNDTRMEIRANWDQLLPAGGGSVSIPDWNSYPLLGKPLNQDSSKGNSTYEVSWTRALRCLYFVIDSYHQLTLSNGSLSGTTATHDEARAVECFEYMRSHILCSADMTLEGERTGSGQGGESHMCRDRDDAIKWIEKRRVGDSKSIF